MTVLLGSYNLLQQLEGPDWYIVIPTIVLAFGTLYLVKVTNHYARQTEKLVGQTERLAGQTERLAASTQQSVTQASLRQQLETSMYLWERINEKYDPIAAIGRAKGYPKDGSGVIEVDWEMLRSLFNEIDFFAYLVDVDMIKDEKALSYFRHRLTGYIKTIMRHYASANTGRNLRDEFHYFNRLVKKWNIDIPNEKS